MSPKHCRSAAYLAPLKQHLPERIVLVRVFCANCGEEIGDFTKPARADSAKRGLLEKRLGVVLSIVVGHGDKA